MAKRGSPVAEKAYQFLGVSTPITLFAGAPGLMQRKIFGITPVFQKFI